MMENYKIKVNNEAESKEAQELFFELGFQWYKEDKGVFWETTSGFIFANANTKFLMGGVLVDVDTYLPVTISQLRNLVAEKKNENGLISGDDALRALADGKEVEYSVAGENKWHDNILNITPYYFIGNGVGQFEFRLKPRTIAINGIEIPAPFEPKVGEKYWFIADYVSSGYSDTQEGTGINSSIGKWRSEEQIKQVVAALRSVFKCK